MSDFVLQISYPRDLEEVVFARLYLTRSTGNVSDADGALSAYFETAADRDAAAEVLRDLPVKLRLEQQERVDWLDHYHQSLTPLFVGNNFVIAPDESLLTSDRLHRLVIPQAQALGTGSPESTGLCIELLEEIDLHDPAGHDTGPGGGILPFSLRPPVPPRPLPLDANPYPRGPTPPPPP